MHFKKTSACSMSESNTHATALVPGPSFESFPASSSSLPSGRNLRQGSWAAGIATGSPVVHQFPCERRRTNTVSTKKRTVDSALRDHGERRGREASDSARRASSSVGSKKHPDTSGTGTGLLVFQNGLVSGGRSGVVDLLVSG